MAITNGVLVGSTAVPGSFDMNIEGTDVGALNAVFQGDAERFKEYLFAKIKARETEQAAKSKSPENTSS